jgi:hypothetical protein
MRRYLINQGVIARLVDYYMGSYSPLWQQQQPQSSRTALGDSTEMDFKEFVNTLANAVCSCYVEPPQQQPSETTVSKLPPPTAFTVRLSFIYSNSEYLCVSVNGGREGGWVGGWVGGWRYNMKRTIHFPSSLSQQKMTLCVCVYIYIL